MATFISYRFFEIVSPLFKNEQYKGQVFVIIHKTKYWYNTLKYTQTVDINPRKNVLNYPRRVTENPV